MDDKKLNNVERLERLELIVLILAEHSIDTDVEKVVPKILSGEINNVSEYNTYVDKLRSKARETIEKKPKWKRWIPHQPFPHLFKMKVD